MVGALIIGLVMSVLGIISQYMTINSEPIGSSFTLAQGIGTFACLIGAIGGFIATRHYAKENEITFPIGKGALIGFMTGVVGVLVSTVISVIWQFVVDPELNQAVYDWSVRNLEAQNLPAEQFEMALNFIPEPGAMSSLLWAVGIGIVAVGVLNLISGIIGAKVFASEEE
jgi:hypothetical protein